MSRFINQINKIGFNSRSIKLEVVLIFSFLTVNGFAQDNIPRVYSRNAFFAEFDYTSDLDLYSILYDRLVDSKGRLKIGVQCGLTYTSKIETADKGYSIFLPLKCYFLIGKEKHNFEMGLGVRILDFPYPDFNVGYRYRQNVNGFSFRAGYSGLILYGGLNNMISLSIGYTF